MSVVLGAAALSAVTFCYIRSIRHYRESRRTRDKDPYREAIEEYEKFMKNR